MVTMGAPDRGTYPGFPDYWFVPGTLSHLHVPGVTGSGEVPGGVFNVHSAGHPLQRGGT